MQKIALSSEPASPLRVIGGVDAGGQDIPVANVAKRLARERIALRARGRVRRAGRRRVAERLRGGAGRPVLGGPAPGGRRSAADTRRSAICDSRRPLPPIARGRLPLILGSSWISVDGAYRPKADIRHSW